MVYRLSLLLLYVCIIVSCANNSRTNNATTDKGLKYSELLSVNCNDSFTVVNIRNPWDTTKLLHRYILVPADRSLPNSLPKGDIVRTPLRNIAVFSSVHCGVMDELGAFNHIHGVCDREYIYIQKVQQALADGSITDFGNSMTPNTERIIEQHPDAILLSPYENSGSYGKLGKLGITLIECADYMESSPLGRAEWIKFYGLLMGRENTADSIFHAVEKQYNDIKRHVANSKTCPTVVTEMKSGSTWYIAGNKSTVGQLINDAGGRYIFDDLNISGAQPFSPEKAFIRAQKADYWLIKYNYAKDMTLRDLAKEWPSNAYMKAYKDGNVYGCNLHYSRIFEETPFHPELLLKEIANILHPENASIKNGGQGVYYKKLER